ncbi:MAG TPA: ATP-binding protein [Gammaproteobacteria bacterium]|jgi:hypothetical protein
MTTLRKLILDEHPHSGLAFRESIYKPGEDDQVIVDCLALANSDCRGRRYLFFGVDAYDEASRGLVGVDRDELVRFKQRFKRLIARYIEPEFEATVRAVEIDGCLVGFVRIDDCSTPPYLARRTLGKRLQVGQGYIRRGTRNRPLSRSDLKRMFAGVREPARTTAAVRIGFAAQEPLERVTLRALSVSKLPSELAAERLKSMLELNDQSRALFGQTQTRLTRLMHAKLYGAEVPFEKHSDDSLVSALTNVDIDYSAADAHYLYEVRAHRLNLSVINETDENLHDAVLYLSMPVVEGAGVADRVHAEDQIEPGQDAGYPSVDSDGRTVSVEAQLGTLYVGRNTPAFREPARFWARPEAAGKAVPIDYELVARELDSPVKGSLIIYLEKEGAPTA